MTLFALNLSKITLDVNTPIIDLGGSLLSLDKPIPSGLPAGSMCIWGKAHPINAHSMDAVRSSVGNDNTLRIDEIFNFPTLEIGIKIPESGRLRRGAGSVDHDPGSLVQWESAQDDYSNFDTVDTHLQTVCALQSNRQFERMDFAAVKIEAMEFVEQILAEILPDGFIEESEYVALNPTRDDRNAGSFRINITSGRWADFATDDKGGDLISLVKFVCKLNYQADAARKIQEIIAKIRSTGGTTPSSGTTRPKAKRNERTINLSFVSPVPDSAPSVPLTHYKYGDASYTWEYRNKDGKLDHYRLRFDPPFENSDSEKKQVLPATLWRDNQTGRLKWEYLDSPGPAKLYNLDDICKHPDRIVVFCEGEKAADAAMDVFPGYVVTTTPGGASRAGGADLEPLKGCEILFIPDADEAGDKYLHSVAKRLLALGCRIRVVDSRAVSQVAQDGDDRDEPMDGWDCADAYDEWHDLEALRLMLLDHVSDYAPPVSEAPQASGAPPVSEVPRVGNNTNEHLTDLGNAHRLARHCDGNIRYVHALKAWFIWNGDRWERDTNGEIFRLAHQTVEQIFQDSSQIEDETQRTALRKFALASEKRAAFENMVALAQNLPGIPLSHEKLDADPYLLGVKNGVVDLRTGKFRKGRPEDFITKQANVIYEPVADCPNWQAFQKKIACDDDELVAFKKRAFGAVLSGLFIEAMFIQHGQGANGKTTETETISFIMGDYAGVADSQIMMAPHNNGGATPELAGLKGKRHICVNESAENDTLNEARVKYITTDGAITARNVYEGLITFNPTHKIFLATNHKPRIRGTDHGIWRRIHYVPYGHTFSEAEKVEGFREKVLLPEASGILNWLIEGCREWLGNGRRLNPPKKVTEAAADYRKEQDTVAQFMEVHWPYPDPTLSVELELSNLHYTYQSWMLTELNWKGLGRKRFADELVRLGYQRARNARNVTVFKGASSTAPNAPPEPIPF